MTMAVAIVEKGTKEFTDAKQKFFELFFNKTASDQYYNPNPLGARSRVVDEHLSEIPMPFGCPSLLVNPTMDGEKVTGVIWFCERAGCICVCCREDFTRENEKYPNYCPSESEFLDTGEPCDCGSSTCDECNPGWWEDEEEGLEDF
jgi:hypothetical protein